MITRTAIVVTITGGIAVVYAVVRSYVFGTAFGGYTEYWSTPRIAWLESRAFLLRAFLPASILLGVENLTRVGIVARLGRIVRRPSRRDRCHGRGGCHGHCHRQGRWR